MTRLIALVRMALLTVVVMAALGGIERLVPVRVRPLVEWLVVLVYFAFGVWVMLWQFRAHAAIRAERRS